MPLEKGGGFLEGTLHLHAGGGLGLSGRRGDFAERVALVETEEDDGAVAVGKGGDGLVEVIVIGVAAGNLGSLRAGGGEALETLAPACLRALGFGGFVDGRAEEPAGDGGVVGELTRLAGEGGEDVLGDLLGGLVVAGFAECDGEDHRGMALDEEAEGIVVAAASVGF